MISVIIPTYNSWDTLLQAIQSVLDQNSSIDKSRHVDYELIVVDDGSIDDTKHLKSNPENNLRVIHTRNSGPAAARNRGVKESKGNIIAFLDADARAPINWLYAISRISEVSELKEGYTAFGGQLWSNQNTPITAFEQTRRDGLYGLQSNEDINGLPSCNLILSKKIIEKVGGFDEEFKHASGEDYDLCWRLREQGYKLRYYPTIFVYHKHETDRNKVLQKARLHARENVLLRKKHGGTKRKEYLKFITRLPMPIIGLIDATEDDLFLAVEYELMIQRGQLEGIRKYY